MTHAVIHDMPRKEVVFEKRIDAGMHYDAQVMGYTGIGKRFEAGLKSLLARADLDLEVLDVRHLVENHDEWMVVEVQIGEPLGLVREGSHMTPYRVAGAKFFTALRLAPTGRIDCRPSDLNSGEIWVASSNLERAGTDPFSVFRLDAHTIWQLSERIWVQLAWQLLKQKAAA